MAAPLKRIFHFHASGHALSGEFIRPIRESIEVQAATTLPTIGGHGDARVEQFRHRHFVSFNAGYSHVSGSKYHKDDKDFYTTLVTATVENLNFLDVVSADRVVSRVSSYHILPNNESHFSFVGAQFVGLKIAGHPVEIVMNDRLFAHLDTFDKVKKELETDKDFKKMAEDPFHTGTRSKVGEDHGEILCSIIKELKTDAPGVTVEGHALVVPQFGRIYVGEALLGPCKRTLTMLRLELGSPVEGSGTISQVVGNGATWP
jgi:hypothetical protein